MTRINLLPPEKVKERGRGAGRGMIVLLFVLPLLVLALMGYLWFSANSRVNDKKQVLEQTEQELETVKAKTAALQQYKERQQEIQRIEGTVIQALQGRVFWARILNEIAIMCPNDIWLTSLNGTSAQGGGQVSFEGYALQCPNRTWMYGSFYPYLPDYRPIAGWLERMAQILEFDRVWLSGAEPTQHGGGTTSTGEIIPGTWLIRFSSTAYLDMDTATIGGVPAAVTPPPTTPTTPEETETEGIE